MTGRLEDENKTFLSIESKLYKMPKFIKLWYLNLRASDCSSKTCKDYIKKIHKFLLSINNDPSLITIKDITQEKITSYFISIKVKIKNGETYPTSDSYQQSVWCVLNNLFKFLLENDYIEFNPMRTIKKPKNKDLVRINKNRIFLTKGDYTKILNSIETGCGSSKAKKFQEKMKERDKSIFLIFMTTGIRESALAQINISDIDFNKKILYVLDKGDLYRECVLTENTINIIKEWMLKRKDIATDQSLFVSYQGKRMSSTSIYNLIQKYCDDALGYKISPHKFRSGFISIMYKETGDIEKVRRMVGHANISTTQRYIVTEGKEKEEAAKIMSDLF